jgi:hypothetical protein
MSMKIPVLGCAFGVVMAAFIGAVQARDDGRYCYLRSGHGLTASGPARDRAVRMRMLLLCRTLIGNQRAATTVSASTTNGSTSPTMP